MMLFVFGTFSKFESTNKLGSFCRQIVQVCMMVLFFGNNVHCQTYCLANFYYFFKSLSRILCIILLIWITQIKISVPPKNGQN